jgi:hypothetical protein
MVRRRLRGLPARLHGCTYAESNQIKLHGARRLAGKEAREGSLDPAYARRQAATWEARALAKARESRAGRGGRARAGTVAAGVARSARAGRDSLERGTFPEELAQVAGINAIIDYGRACTPADTLPQPRSPSATSTRLSRGSGSKDPA